MAIGDRIIDEESKRIADRVSRAGLTPSDVAAHAIIPEKEPITPSPIWERPVGEIIRGATERARETVLPPRRIVPARSGESIVPIGLPQKPTQFISGMEPEPTYGREALIETTRGGGYVAPTRAGIVPTEEYTETWGAEPATTKTAIGDIGARQRIYGEGGLIDQIRRGLVEELEGEYTTRQKLGLEETQRTRSAEAMQRLDLERAAGIVPPTGMAEYEASATRIKKGEAKIPGVEEGRRAYVAGQQAIEKERIGIIPKVAEEQRKTTAEVAKLGLTAQDVASKIKLRTVQMQDLFTKSNYLEPMKLELQNAKTIDERNRVQKSYYYKFAQDLRKGEAERLKTMYPVGGPEYETADKKSETDFQLRVNDIEFMFAKAGDIRKDPITGKLIQAVPANTAKGFKWQPYRETPVVPER